MLLLSIEEFDLLSMFMVRKELLPITADLDRRLLFLLEFLANDNDGILSELLINDLFCYGSLHGGVGESWTFNAERYFKLGKLLSDHFERVFSLCARFFGSLLSILPLTVDTSKMSKV